MSGFITLDEFTSANKLVREKLKGHESVPVALAMISAGIDFLMKVRKPEYIVREFCEKAIAHSRGGTVVMPSPTEVARLLGNAHGDEDK